MGLRKSARGTFTVFTAESIAAKASTDLLSKGMFNQAEATNVLRAALDTLNLELEQVAKNMNLVGTASGTAMARQSGAAASASAMVSGASAASLAARGGSVVGMLHKGNRSSSSSFGGAEFSHLHPDTFLPDNIKNVQTV